MTAGFLALATTYLPGFARRANRSVGSYGYIIREMTEMAVAWFGQCSHSNQPAHGTIHQAAAVGFGGVTNRLTHRVLNEYHTPDSFPGDEDKAKRARGTCSPRWVSSRSAPVPENTS